MGYYSIWRNFVTIIPIYWQKLQELRNIYITRESIILIAIDNNWRNPKEWNRKIWNWQINSLFTFKGWWKPARCEENINLIYVAINWIRWMLQSYSSLGKKVRRSRTLIEINWIYQRWKANFQPAFERLSKLNDFICCWLSR